MWNNKYSPMDRADYKETVYDFEILKSKVQKFDARSERKLIDLKQGYSICYYEYADDKGIHLSKYMPAGDVRREEHVTITTSELMLEGLTNLPKELEAAALRLVLINELTGEIYVPGMYLRKTGNKMGITISGPDSNIKAMYQAQQIKEQIEDSANPNNDFGKFYAQTRRIGRSGKFHRIFTAFGLKGNNGQRRPFSEIPRFLEKLDDFYDELGSFSFIQGTISSDGMEVIVEFEKEIEGFYERSGGMQATPCYAIDITDTAEFTCCVRPAFSIGENIAYLPCEPTEVKTNESYLRSFKDAHDAIEEYIANNPKERFEQKVFDAKSCLDPFDIKKFKSNDDIVQVSSVVNDSEEEFTAQFTEAKNSNEEELRINLTLIIGDNMKFPNTLRKLQAQQAGLGVIYLK